MSDQLTRCKNCVMLSTRPRVEYDARGWCNACTWAEEKKTIDWPSRWKKVEELCDKYRSKEGFDVLVGVSGGKDGSYVSRLLKDKLGMNPLTITIAVPLSMKIGNQNLENFIDSGFDHVRVTPNPIISRKVNKIGLVEQGRPLYGWQCNLQVAVLRTALAFKIPFIMYGEDGEVEYGGSTESKNQWSYSVGYAIRVYLSGEDPKAIIGKLGGQYTEKELYWWLYPSAEEIATVDPRASHWSHFEDWDPYSHYLIAKEKCGLQDREEASVGTYTNFSQTDTTLFDLHMYFMYLKFGFGRCTQDCGIDIRRGAMTRKQGLELLKVYDDQFPEEYVPGYLDYFEMTRAEFDAVLDKWANKKLLKKENGRWVRNFEVT
jgi:N-acetyl sugar amidotransferase